MSALTITENGFPLIADMLIHQLLVCHFLNSLVNFFAVDRYNWMVHFSLYLYSIISRDYIVKQYALKFHIYSTPHTYYMHFLGWPDQVNVTRRKLVNTIVLKQKVGGLMMDKQVLAPLGVWFPL